MDAGPESGARKRFVANKHMDSGRNRISRVVWRESAQPERVAEVARTVDRETIIAIGLLTNTHVRMLGNSLKHVFPLADDDAFADLLKALDQIDPETGR